MRLQYRVLWFEDDYDLVNVDIGPELEEYLDNLGFTLYLVHQENGINLDNFLDKDFDLILTDLNLGDGHEAGDRVVDNIRNSKILTEVLLYSGNEEGIEKIISNHGLIERVSFSVGTSNLKDKIMQIILLSVKKVQDINNLRGLVMAEASELDHKMLSILQEFYLKGVEEHKIELCKYIFRMMDESFAGNTKRLVKYKDSNSVGELIASPLFDSSKKNRAINKLLEIICESDLAACRVSYKEEIIDIRNVLGHVIEQSDEDGKLVLVSIIPGYEPVVFDDKMCVTIRKSIHKHSSNLSQILKIFE